MTTLLTCISCRETFETPSQQREHYHTDYHRFNAKRKIVDLPPVSEEVFLKKVEELKIKQTTKQTFTGHCSYCKKSFASESTYKSHILSKKHLDRERAAKNSANGSSGPGATSSITTTYLTEETAETKQEALSDESEPQTEEEIMEEKMKNAHHFELTDCIFCNRASATFEENLEHMTKTHGFFIPDIEYLSDLEGFIAYLGQKVGAANICLHCDKMFSNCSAVQSHMASLSHAKLPSEDTYEYDDFYDFSSTWEEDGEGESEDGEHEHDPDNLQLVARSGKGVVDVDDGGYTLTLGSGRKVGHRDLLIYYKQNYRRGERDPKALRSTIHHYKALGWHTSDANSERRARMQYDRIQKKHSQQVGIKANKLQTHYRAQVMF